MYRRLVLLLHRPCRRISISQQPASASTVVPPTRKLCSAYRSISSSGAPHSLAAVFIHEMASALFVPATTVRASGRDDLACTHLRPLYNIIVAATGQKSGSPDRNNIIVAFVFVLSFNHVTDTDTGCPLWPFHWTPSPTQRISSLISRAFPAVPHSSPPRSRKKNPKTIPPQRIMFGPVTLLFTLASIDRIIRIETGFHGRELSN